MRCMPVLCTGSVAIDHVMVFRGRFKDLLLADRLHVLNVSFHVPELRRTFGGCAANIGFNLRLLGEEPIVLATVGADDFAAFAAWLDQHGIRRDHIVGLAGASTAGAYITTDLDDNQITGFHPGAMDRAHEAPISRVREPYELAFVSPNGKLAMQQHARALKAAGKRVLMDPGQGLPLFEREELIELIEGAELLFANDYEWSLVLEKTGLSEADVVARVGATIVTLGERGSRLLDRHTAAVEIPPVRAREVVDPTGCGDAYRAAFAAGLARGLSLGTCARMGSVLGALMAERHGTQSLTVTPAEFAAHYRQSFGEPLA
jgi:adenosine kinase